MMVTNFALIVLLLWAGSVPVVIPKHYGHMNRKFWGQSVCNKYALPLNMMWTLRTSCEDSKRFQCQPGYQSEVQTTCRNGLWYLEPTCQVYLSAVTCPSGEIINNSDNVTKSGIFGEDFTFDCKAGYRSDDGMTGTMTCDKRGNWADKTTCEVRCPSGENISFSSDVTQSRTVGEEMYYDCLDGYKNSSNNGTLTCGKNGDWAVKRPCEVCYRDKNETLDVSDSSASLNILLASLNFKQSTHGVKTVAECTELCNNVSCSFPFVLGKNCNLIMQPIIFLSSGPYNATACFDKCTELIECVTMIQVAAVCILANVNQNMLPATFKFKFQPNNNDRVAEKICI